MAVQGKEMVCLFQYVLKAVVLTRLAIERRRFLWFNFTEAFVELR